MFRTIITAFLVAGMVLQGVGLAVEAPEPKSNILLEKELQPQILGFVYVISLPDLCSKLSAAKGIKIYEEILEVVKAEKKDDAEFKEAFEKIPECMEIISEARAAFTGEIFLAVYGKKPQVGLVADVDGANLKKMLDRLGKFVKEAGGNITIATQNNSGSIKLKGAEIIYRIADGKLAAGTSEEALKEIRAVEKAFPAVAEYGRALKKVDSDNDMVAFVNAAKFMEFFGDKIEPKPQKILNQLGILNIESMITALKIANEGSFSKASLVFKDSNKGVFEVFASSNVGPTVQKYIPANHNLFFRLKFAGFLDVWNVFCDNFKALAEEAEWENFQQGLKKFKEESGLDLEQDILVPLGGELAVSVEIPRMLGIPPALVFLEVKDQKKFEQTLGKIFEKADLKFITTKYENYTICTITVPMVQPSYSFKDNYMIVALTPADLRNTLMLKVEDSLLGKAEYKAVRSHLPEKGTIEGYEEIDKTINLVISSLNMAMARGNVDPLVSKIMAIVQAKLIEAWPVGSILTSDANSITIHQYEKSGTTLFSVAGAGVLAGMLLPALSRAREAARNAACTGRLRQICIALMMYQDDHDGKYPEKLSALYPRYISSFELFTCPFAEGVAIKDASKIDTKCSYLFRRGATAADAPDSPVICDKFENHRGRHINVGYVDAHVKQVQLTDKVREKFSKLFGIDKVSSFPPQNRNLSK